MFRLAIFLALALASFATLDISVAAQNRGNGNGNSGDKTQPPGCIANPNPRIKNPNCRELTVTVESDVDFGRLVLLGDGNGRVILDLVTGQKTVIGEIDDLGGMPVQGRATITGQPREPIRVDLPTEIIMADPAGGEAIMRDIVTDLPAFAVLDGNGQLTFQFSGTLFTDVATALGGRLRGRIPINVDYE
jgi:hypothetical protein